MSLLISLLINDSCFINICSLMWTPFKFFPWIRISPFMYLKHLQVQFPYSVKYFQAYKDIIMRSVAFLPDLRRLLDHYPLLRGRWAETMSLCWLQSRCILVKFLWKQTIMRTICLTESHFLCWCGSGQRHHHQLVKAQGFLCFYAIVIMRHSNVNILMFGN